ncbi:MAG: hypothetical protein A3B70_01335 [Deltaproteobacteria bacterium RIFCSPHIGHO2_02_FULL_40_11]|nr:MAG: hypothetical protein A3B70_01335 [Deltaproteobacteria bacterium RIFCSPHIGHO2_02_FULL_40_11]
MSSYFWTGETSTISIQGKDAKTFLNNVSTNHILRLHPKEICLTCLCNKKGRVMSLFYCVCEDENMFYLVMDHALKEKTLNLLQSYIILEDVKIVDESSSPTGIDAVKEKISFTEKEELRIQMGVPKYGIDLTEENLPQEANLEDALNFQKGCYIGQEVIARLHNLGHVNKKLCVFQIEGNEIPPKDTKIFLDTSEVGWITSACLSEDQKIVALGYVKYQYLGENVLHTKRTTTPAATGLVRVIERKTSPR